MEVLVRWTNRVNGGVSISGAAAVFMTGCQLMLTDASIEADTTLEDETVTEEEGVSCDDYCNTIAETCTGDNIQYRSTQLCLNVCETFEEGNEADESGNTASCRMHYAIESAEAPDTYCRAAGPGGQGVCGSDCESFCSIQAAVCVEDNVQYPTITECMGACVSFDNSVPYNADVMGGDSFACRLTHLTLASGSPDVHCPHIQAVSPICF